MIDLNEHEAANTPESDLADFFAANEAHSTDLDDDATQIGRRITDARDALGMDIDELAERLVVTASTVRGWESGEEPPLANHLNKVAGVLGVGLSWLIIGRGVEPLADPSQLGQLRADLGAARSRLDDVVNELAVLDQRLAQLDDR